VPERRWAADTMESRVDVPPRSSVTRLAAAPRWTKDCNFQNNIADYFVITLLWNFETAGLKLHANCRMAADVIGIGGLSGDRTGFEVSHSIVVTSYNNTVLLLHWWSFFKENYVIAAARDDCSSPFAESKLTEKKQPDVTRYASINFTYWYLASEWSRARFLCIHVLWKWRTFVISIVFIILNLICYNAFISSTIIQNVSCFGFWILCEPLRV